MLEMASSNQKYRKAQIKSQEIRIKQYLHWMHGVSGVAG